MPTVPRQELLQVGESQGPDVKMQDFSRIENFGGGQTVGQGFQQLGNIGESLTKIAAEQKQEADKLRVYELSTKLRTEKQKLLYGQETDATGNVKNYGLMYRSGKDAFGVPEEFSKGYRKIVDEVMKEAGNDQQKAALHRFALDAEADAGDLILKHVGAEAEKHEKLVFESSLEATRNEALLNFMDPEAVRKSIELQRVMVYDRFGRKVEDPVLANEFVKVASETHYGVIKRMLGQGNDLAAKRYYESLQGKDSELTGEHKEKLDGLIKEQTKLGEALRVSDQIVSKYPNSMTAALKMARESVEDPDVQELTVQKVKQRFQEMDAADQMRRENAHKRATTIIEKTGSVDEVMRKMPEEWANFTLSERNALKNYANGEGVEKLSEQYYRLRREAMENPTKFKDLNLYSYKGKVNGSELEGLIDIQAQLRSGKGAKELDDWRTEESIVSGTLNRVGIDPTPKPGTDAANQVAKFRAEVAKRVTKLQEQTGKAATNEDYERIANALTVEVVTKRGWIWDTKKKAFELNEGEAMDIESIPDSERLDIERAIRAKGKPVTNEEIVRIYMKGLGL